MKFDPESQGLVSGENTGQKPPKTTAELLAGAFCNALVMIGIGSYAIYVGAKYKTNSTPQCVSDINWLNVYGYGSLILSIIPILIVPFAKSTPGSAGAGIAQGMSALVGCGGCFFCGKFFKLFFSPPPPLFFILYPFFLFFIPPQLIMVNMLIDQERDFNFSILHLFFLQVGRSTELSW